MEITRITPQGSKIKSGYTLQQVLKWSSFKGVDVNMLVSVAELKEWLVSDNTVVFDCRFSLQDAGRGHAQYLEGHIPGAYYLHLNDDLSSQVGSRGGRHPLPGADAFAAVMNRCGVNENSRIVVYDNGEGMATRAWWLLRYFGHQQVAVLNGGWRAWMASNMSVSTVIPPSKEGRFVPHANAGWIVSATDVERMVEGQLNDVLVDARAADRFRGENETIDSAGGHIPGAINAPWTQGLDEDGFWKSGEAQRNRFAHIPVDRPMVMYCGSGVTACANLFALELAGISGVRLYAGSWSDWISNPHHPIAKG